MRVLFLVTAFVAAIPALAAAVTNPASPVAVTPLAAPMQDARKMTPGQLRLREPMLYDSRRHLVNPHEPSRQIADGPSIR